MCLNYPIFCCYDKNNQKWATYEREFCFPPPQIFVDRVANIERLHETLADDVMARACVRDQKRTQEARKLKEASPSL